MKYCLNVEELFPDLDFYDKFKAAKKAGYDCVEFWGWDQRDVKKIKEQCDANGVQVTAFKGELNWSLCDNETSEGFIDWTKKCVETANSLGCENIIVHSNHLGPNGEADFSGKYSDVRLAANITSNLIKVAPIMESGGVNMQIEPLSKTGFPNMFLSNMEPAADIIRVVGSPNIKLLCDVFQSQVMEGNVTKHMLNNLDIMNYIHMADSPDRGQPGTGELNYTYILNTLKENGFDGIACFELTPQGSTESVLEAIAELRKTVK